LTIHDRSGQITIPDTLPDATMNGAVSQGGVDPPPLVRGGAGVAASSSGGLPHLDLERLGLRRV
jgi:hypothetical protein